MRRSTSEGCCLRRAQQTTQDFHASTNSESCYCVCCRRLKNIFRDRDRCCCKDPFWSWNLHIAKLTPHSMLHTMHQSWIFPPWLVPFLFIREQVGGCGGSRKGWQAVESDADVLWGWPEIGTVEQEETKLQLGYWISKKKEATYDLSPKPAMVKELFWQERTSKEVAIRRSVWWIPRACPNGISSWPAERLSMVHVYILHETDITIATR